MRKKFGVIQIASIIFVVVASLFTVYILTQNKNVAPEDNKAATPPPAITLSTSCTSGTGNVPRINIAWPGYPAGTVDQHPAYYIEINDVNNWSAYWQASISSIITTSGYTGPNVFTPGVGKSGNLVVQQNKTYYVRVKYMLYTPIVYSQTASITTCSFLTPPPTPPRITLASSCTSGTGNVPRIDISWPGYPAGTVDQKPAYYIEMNDANNWSAYWQVAISSIITTSGYTSPNIFTPGIGKSANLVVQQNKTYYVRVKYMLYTSIVYSQTASITTCSFTSPTPTLTPTPSPVPTATPKPQPSPTPKPKTSPKPTATHVPAPSSTPTPTVTPTQSETLTPTPSETVSPTSIETPTVTQTPSAEESIVPTPTITPTTTKNNNILAIILIIIGITLLIIAFVLSARLVSRFI